MPYFGSRTLGKGALAGGMPLYKYLANRALTLFQNAMLGQKLSEYHTGYRAWSRTVLQSLPLMRCSDNFVFDNEILVQAVHHGFRIGEISCPARYFPEASSINLPRSIKYRTRRGAHVHRISAASHGIDGRGGSLRQGDGTPAAATRRPARSLGWSGGSSAARATAWRRRGGDFCSPRGTAKSAGWRMLNHGTMVAAVRDGRWVTRERVCNYPKICLAIFLVGLTWLVFSPVGPRWIGSDFAGFWVPAKLAASGRTTIIYDQPLFAALQQAVSGRSDMYLPWVYPPTFLLLILPLGALAYVTAFVVWIAAGLAVYWAALRKLVGREGIVAALAFPGVMICIFNGHAEILLAGLFGGAMLLLDRRPCIAGLLIGLCTVKPHLFLMVPVALLAGCRWRAIVSAALLSLLGMAISVAIFGTEVWREFF